MRKTITLLALCIFVAMLCTIGFAACSKAITVTFIVDGETYYTANVKDGEITMPDDPTKSGYAFAGWYLDENFVSMFKSRTAQTLTENVSVYAKWQCLHSRKSDWIIDEEDTCTTVGRRHKLCLVCGEVVDSSTYDDTRHNYSDWTVTRETSCSQAGVRQRTCSVCRHVEKQSIDKLPHTYGEYETTKEPTCSELGSKQRVCEVCGYVDKVDIAKLEHTFGASVVIKQPSCDTYGTTEYACTVCGETKIVNDIAPIGYHVPDDDYVCTVCGKKCSSNWEDTTFVLPTTPFNQKDYWFGGKYSMVTITSIVVEDQYQPNAYHYYHNFYIYISGEKIFDNYHGSSESATHHISWKLYDLDGVVVKSGTAITNSLCVGDKFKNEKIYIYDDDIEPGKTYWLVILDND